MNLDDKFRTIETLKLFVMLEHLTHYEREIPRLNTLGGILGRES